MGKLVRSLAIPSLALLFLIGGAQARAQNIIVNGGFNTDVSSWSLDPGYGSFQWSPDGSLLLINDALPAGQTASVSQCDSISGGNFYDLGARVQPVNFVGGPQHSGPRLVEHTGTMYVLLDFFPLDGCRGSGLPQFVRVSASGNNGVWQSIGQTFFAPSSAASVLTSLAILKNQNESDLQGYFDDISIAPSGPVQPPVADFSFIPTSGYTGQAVQFFDASTGGPTGWSWDFGDPTSGSANTSALKNQAHFFAAVGVYTVTLTASNTGGSSTKTHPITVVQPPPPPPVANFVFTPSSPSPGQTVQFSDSSSGTPTTWSWSFGDPSSGASNSSTLQNPTHIFGLPGVYSVTLSASNAGGTGLRNHAITVAASSPVASFSFSPSTPSPGQPVQFLDSSTGGPTTWSWNFGDPSSGASNTSTAQNPTHTFALPGVYTVTLTSSNAVGTGAGTENITVNCVRCPRVVPFR
jgi:PKD repeat protein